MVALFSLWFILVIMYASEGDPPPEVTSTTWLTRALFEYWSINLNVPDIILIYALVCTCYLSLNTTSWVVLSLQLSEFCRGGYGRETPRRLFWKRLIFCSTTGLGRIIRSIITVFDKNRCSEAMQNILKTLKCEFYSIFCKVTSTTLFLAETSICVIWIFIWYKY